MDETCPVADSYKLVQEIGLDKAELQIVNDNHALNNYF